MAAGIGVGRLPAGGHADRSPGSRARSSRVGLVSRITGGSRVETEYELTAAGRDLGRVVGSLAEWGLRWLIPDAEPVEIDPDGLMQWIWRHVELDELPREGVVVAFEGLATPPRRFRLVVRG